tara:strand:- start:2287 stop:3750 length:1464 start_codon:yes stop_codon:yes gene_type:complete
MSFHIIIIVIVLSLLLLFYNSNNKEGFTIPADISSIARERLSAQKIRCVDEIKEIIGDSMDLSRGDIDEFHRREIIKANIMVDNTAEYTPEDRLLMESLLEEIKDNNPEQREQLDMNENEEVNIIGSKLSLLTKKEVYDKYKELKESCTIQAPSSCIAYAEEDINTCNQFDNDEASCSAEEKCMYFQDYQKATVFSKLQYYRDKINELESLRNNLSNLETEKNQIEEEKLRIHGELNNVRSQYESLSGLLEGSNHREKEAYIDDLERKEGELVVLNQWRGWGQNRNVNQKVNYLNEMKSGRENCNREKETMQRTHRQELQRQIANRNRIKRQLNRIASKLIKLKQLKQRRSSRRASPVKKCGNRKKVSPNCNIGRPSRATCNRRYSTYRGKDIMCQYVRKGRRYSCDFWKPGKPYTKKLCRPSSSTRRCPGKRMVSNCNAGRPRRNQCRGRYSVYRGSPFQCQYVRKGRRYSCDLWKPGKPYTRIAC